MITPGLLEEIKSRIDIVDFISRYVQLKKAGQNWKGLCPFHGEKTPSFTVSQAKQIFHCFGCHAGGDIIAFASKYENLSFNEAVSFLAKQAGIKIAEGKNDKELKRTEQVRKALASAADYFRRRLADSPKALDYLKGRGLTDASVEKFMIGYAPPGWHNLLWGLKKSGVGEDVAREAGLAVSGEKGHYDLFRDRIIFPITSASGAVVAFGGRAMGDGMPKYLNSPETSVFRKSETLYGLYQAKEEIKRDGVMLVEGYLDVIVCHQFGFVNAVAPLGTALTAGHIQRLRTLSSSAVLVFDGDAAGRAAAKRALSLICRSNMQARILVLPEGEDPDSFLKRHGRDAFMSLIKASSSVIGFILGMAEGGRKEKVRQAISLISGVDDVLTADEMIRELAEMTGTGEAAIREEFKRLKRGDAAAQTGASEMTAQVMDREGLLLLSAVISFPEKAAYVLSRLDLDDLKDGAVRSLFSRISTLKDPADFSSAFGSAPDKERHLANRLSVEPGFDPEFVDRSIEDCFKMIEKRKLDERISAAKRSGDPGLINSLIAEKKKLSEGMNI